MKFRKYQHIERFGTSDTDGIVFGKCYVQPKIDGANASIWCDNDTIKYGSRNRTLSLDYDNQRFMETMVTQPNKSRIEAFFEKYPNHRLYGEWLVPHTIRTYRKEAWNKFYIFDVTEMKEDGEHERTLSYEEYIPLITEFGFEYIPLQCIILNPTEEQLLAEMEKNTFLIEDGKGFGEGIVIKNYGFVNKYHRECHAKLVRNEFKEKSGVEFGVKVRQGQLITEVDIVDKLLTEAMVEKTYAKILNDKGEWKSQYIQMLLGVVYHDFIIEEIWQIIKDFKNPVINFKTLRALVYQRVKEYKKELF